MFIIRRIAPTIGLAAGLTAAQHAAAQTQPPGYYGTYAVEPRYGSPNSMQFQSTAVALDLATVQPEGADAFLPEGDADTIGGALTIFKAGIQKGQRYELRYQHARRIGEGSRARFLLDVPLSVTHADDYTIPAFTIGNFTIPAFTQKGGTAVYGTISAGIEYPVTPNWLLTPRIAYSNLQAPAYFAHDGELGTLSLTSRYKIARVGRGDLVLGNMVAYTQTLKTPLAHQDFYSSQGNFVLRNGLAYQLPLKSRMFGRQSSIRASYVFTYTSGGTFVPYRQIHEFGINLGVRTREAEQKNGFEQLRAGLLYTHGKSELDPHSGYDAATLTLGYRF